jgi:lysophospholipase L1-like esterase
MFDTWEAHRRPIRPGSRGWVLFRPVAHGRHAAVTLAPLAAADGTVGSAVLLVGESTVAGCGSPTQVEAFGGQLGAALAAQLGRAVTWHAVGRIGVTARRAIDELEPGVAAAAAITPVDVALIALGANDALRRRSTQAYITALADVVAMVRRPCRARGWSRVRV